MGGGGDRGIDAGILFDCLVVVAPVARGGFRRRHGSSVMSELLPFDLGAWIFICVYLLSLLIIGWAGYRARREETLKDFFLAGSGFGLIILVLTLYATQYSGNTLFGFTGQTYRIGYAWVMSVQFMTAIVICYLLFAPHLHQLAKQKGYVTPTDYLNDRFGSNALSVFATVIMVVVLSNFLLAQLMAMGRAMQGLSATHSDAAYSMGVTILALIMVIYGTLGGLRAVAWTDAIQGAILALGFGILLVLLFDQFGTLEQATERILAGSKETALKAAPPDAERNREWLSYVLLVGLGGALYPQAIQRIYAAKSAAVLRRSLAIMVFLPLTTTLVVVIAGVMAIAYLPGLPAAATDEVLTRILGTIQTGSLLGYWLVVVMFAAVLAAMMSTADSAMLSISSMLTKDLYARFLSPRGSERRLMRIGEWFSWVVIIVLVGLAVVLRDRASLVMLLDRKFDLLVQLVPAFMIGIHWRGLKAAPTLVGLVLGVATALVLAYGGLSFVEGGKVGGIHPGLIGLVVNATVACGGSWLVGRLRGT